MEHATLSITREDEATAAEWSDRFAATDLTTFYPDRDHDTSAYRVRKLEFIAAHGWSEYVRIYLDAFPRRNKRLTGHISVADKGAFHRWFADVVRNGEEVRETNTDGPVYEFWESSLQRVSGATGTRETDADGTVNGHREVFGRRPDNSLTCPACGYSERW